MNKIQRTLKDAGLNEKESAVYLALLSLGEASASEIAKSAKIKRTTAYNILPDLVLQGIVKNTIIHGKKIFFIEDVRDLEKREKDKLDTITAAIPELRSIHNIIPHKPRITLYEGISGFKDIYENFINSVPAGGEILTIAGTKNILKYVPEELLYKYVKDRMAKRIMVKIITSPSPLTDDLIKSASTSLRQVKISKDVNFDAISEMIIYTNHIAFISHKENFMGMIIESTELYALHKATFDALWLSL